MKTTLDKNKSLDITLLVARTVLGAVMAAHGAQKLLGWFGGFGFDGTMGFFTETMDFPYLVALLIILGESFGMVALMLGVLTRFFSGVVIVIMIGAIAFSHGQYGFFMNWFGSQAGEGIEYHLLAMTLASFSLINGGGAYSVDRWLFQTRGSEEVVHHSSVVQ